jgi:hypothetical protein
MARIRPTVVVISALLILHLGSYASAVPLGFEIVSNSLITSPFAITTSDFFSDESDGASYTHNIGFATYAADFTVAPEQWIGDAILSLLGLDNSTDLAGIDEAKTQATFSTNLRLTGDPGVQAKVSGSAYVGGIYNQLIGAIPSGDARSLVRLVYSITGVSYPQEETTKNTNNELAAQESGGWILPGSDIPEFTMSVGDIINVTGEFTVRSFAEVNEACLEVCIPYTNICHEECIPGAGFAFSYTDGVGGLSLYATEIQERIDEPNGFALLFLGLLLLTVVAKSSSRNLT